MKNLDQPDQTPEEKDSSVESSQKDPGQTKKKRRTVPLSVFILALVLVAGIAVFLTHQYTSQQIYSSQDFIQGLIQTPSSAVEGDYEKDLSLVEEAYGLLNENYAGDLDQDALIEGAIKGMTEAVDDPYTDYFVDETSDSLDESMTSSFEGIGAEVMADERGIRVVAPMKGSPAEEAGLQANDVITHVDGEPVHDKDLSEGVALIRGPKDTTVTLTIERGDQRTDIPVVRDTIPIETVFYEVIPGQEDVAHIEVSSFAEPTTRELVQAMEDLRAQGVNKYVLDVRNNPGGLLTTGLQISNIFVPDGELIVQVETEGQEPTEYLADSELYGDFKLQDGEEVVLLIDKGSASASEILAGAMQSQGITIVGTPSFGKGTVQSVLPLGEDGQLKFTSGRWLTPEGEWINEKGIQPDVLVEKGPEADLLVIDTRRTFSQGESSEQIANIKGYLRAFGYDLADDGRYDEEMTAAVSDYQSQRGLEVTGSVNSETSASLMADLRDKLDEEDPQLDAAVQEILK